MNTAGQRGYDSSGSQAPAVPSYSRSKPNAPATTLPCYQMCCVHKNGISSRRPEFADHKPRVKDPNCNACGEREMVKRWGRGYIWKCGWYGDRLAGCGHNNYRRCDECIEKGRPKETDK